MSSMGKNECSNLSLSSSVRDKGNLSSNSVLYIMELHKHEIFKTTFPVIEEVFVC